VSIIVPCFGQLEMVRLCVPRLLRHSRNPYEILFVDAGSLDGTGEYLAGVADTSPARVEVLRTEADLDLAAACAAALPHARGESVVLLASDVLVPEGWLVQLTALARLAPDIGMVGAMSNLAPPPQWVGTLPYRIKPKPPASGGNGAVDDGCPFDLGAVDAFARQWRDKHKGRSCAAERLGGPCLLLKAEVLKKIDLANARTPFGALDGDLLSQKVRQAGYRLGCCQDLFLHHFGTRLFAALRIDPGVPPASP
jgi:GT2 family glycosyltransferase